MAPSDNAFISVGSFGDDYAPFAEAFKREQEGITTELAQTRAELDADSVGNGRESVPGRSQSANREWPIFLKDWRGSVDPNEAVTKYIQACQAPFSLPSVLGETRIARQLIPDYEKYHLASRTAHEAMLRRKDYLRNHASDVTFGDPAMSGILINIHAAGDIPIYRGPTPQGLRCRGPPYGHLETGSIMGKLRKDAGRLFVSSRTITANAPLIRRPDTAVIKRLPGRRRSGDKRVIRGGRAADLFMRKTDYRRPALPGIKDIADHITPHKLDYQNVLIKCTKREINSDFRQIRLRPDSRALFSAEFQGSSSGVDYDIIVGYLVLPFGWAGAPGAIASIAEISTRYHNLLSPANELWAGGNIFRIHLFAGDGIPIEPMLASRLEQSASTWEKGIFMAIGNGALNEDKLEVGGLWAPNRIILGYEVDSDKFTIALQAEKILGAHVLIQSHVYAPGNRLMSFAMCKNFAGIWPIDRPRITFGFSPMGRLIGCFHSNIVLKRGLDAINGICGVVAGRLFFLTECL